MEQLSGRNIIVLDLETVRSADDCRWCGFPEAQHYAHGAWAPWRGQQPPEALHHFSALGWNDKPALGLSIGCYYDYVESRLHWFDQSLLVSTLTGLVIRQPLLVSFNGIAFDFPLMRGLVRRDAERPEARAHVPPLVELCDAFKVLCGRSYDLLAAIWKSDPVGKLPRGLTSLDALSQANGYGPKAMDGVTAPRLWAAGRYAEVIEHCVEDVLLTKALFEQVVATGTLLRRNGLPLTLPQPLLPER